MGALTDPYDADEPLWGGCPCGRHKSLSAHNAAATIACEDVVPGSPAAAAMTPAPAATGWKDREAVLAQHAETAILKGIFGTDVNRRAFLLKVGAATALGAIASVLPIDKVKAAIVDATGPIEKPDLNVGYIPITCATPIIMAHPLGFYSRYGLNVNVVKTAGWAVIRDLALAGEYDAAHMLTPMPLAITLGAGATARPWTVPAVENINGQAITLHNRHRDKTDPTQWRGLTFGVPFDYSMHNFLLRYYVAEAGLDPDRDIQIRVVPPPEMVANLTAGNIDGYLAPDPFNQRAVYDGVGFIYKLTRDIWPGHPCCAFAASRQFIDQNPNTFLALYKAIIDATAYSSDPANRVEIAEAIAPTNYLNQPQTVIQQVLTGTFADGLGNVRREPDRIGFDPFPYHSFAIWILTQMKRWGYISGDVSYETIARQVFLATDCQDVMRSMGLEPPEETSRTYVIMGKTFDPAAPEDYINSFAIRRT